MRKLIATEYVTLDGVMEDPGGNKETGRDSWSFPFWNDEAAKYKFDELFASGALLLGRITYQGFAKAWPNMTDEAGFADRMNGLPKYVVTRTLDRLEWNNSSPIRGDIPAEISKLKEQPGKDILLAGSAELFHTLMQHDLIDEYRLMLHPIVVGNGKRLFKDGTDLKTLKLVDTKPFSTGIVILTYAPAEKGPEK